MNLEDRLSSAAKELNQIARQSVPPGLTRAPVRPWLAFTAAFALVITLIGIPLLITNVGSPSDGGPLAGADFTTTTCVLPEVSTTRVETGTAASDSGSISEEAAPASECDRSPATTSTVVEGTSPSDAGSCAAASLYPPTTVAYAGDDSDRRDLTEPVRDKLTRIAEAASRCDASALAALASADITTSFGSDDGPADIAAWESSDERFKIINELFNMSQGVTETPDGSRLFVWPAAFAHDTWDEVLESQKSELLRLYSQEELGQFASFGSYAGWRIGITESGEWIFFVAGD